MARPTRLILDNAIYHVMVRGNQKQATFLEEKDFLKYLELLKHYKKKYTFRLYGYCLMPNHVHLVIEVKKGMHLSKIMQGLNLTYTKWFNEKYKKVGHLWQGRFKSMVIQKDKYLLDCIAYVEFNPIRGNLIKSPHEYQWTSWEDRLNCKENGFINRPQLV